MRCLFLIVLSFTCRTILAQDSTNLYSLENSMKFADYLYANQQYEFAINEYQRVLFLDPGNTRATIYLYESFFNNRQFNLALERFRKKIPLAPLSNDTLRAIYNKILLFAGRYEELQLGLAAGQDCLAKKDQYIFHASSMLLQNKADELEYPRGKEKVYHPEIKEIILTARDIQPKKTWISLTSSAIIPGSGKIYSGFWKDGLMTLLFVSASAWQSYRGFSKNGIESVYGWVFGGLSLSFYAGNLYGSIKATHKRNQVMYHEIHEQVYEYVESKYSY